MISYQSSAQSKTHIVDETVVTHLHTLCGRKVPKNTGILEESDRMPECSVCAAALRALKAPKKAKPLKAAPMPPVDASDLLCPVCREPMRLATKRLSLPTERVGAVRVTMLLLCASDHEESHE